MHRRTLAPRSGWEDKVEDLGLVYHHVRGDLYWDESAFWSITPAEVDDLESATNRLEQMCLLAAQHVIDHQRYAELAIGPAAAAAIERTWEQEPPSVYGRFDFAYDGSQPPKLLEYNADTPTSLLESSVVQWHWLQDLWPEADQFNSIHERLIATWRDLRPRLNGEICYFANGDDDQIEDLLTITYMRETAADAGIPTMQLQMHEIGWHAQRKGFVDLGNRPIGSIFKLYPWEWMVAEEFGNHVLTDTQTQWIEPAWKMLLSNKGILAVLWELYPDHPNLLPAYLDGPHSLDRVVQKPLLSREGANVRIETPDFVDEVQGDYGAEGYVWQGYIPLAQADGNRAVLGSWVIGGESAGIGIRETTGRITDDSSRFVPHRIEDS